MRHYYYRLQDPDTVYGLIRDLFIASGITCFLWALHNIARGVLVLGKIKALDELGDAYTPEEREVLIHKIKVKTLHR